ncbi:MAG: hypothetical protein ACFNZU_02230 [Capnocytophaga granulosa]
MENTEIRAQVLAIVETFGMKGKVVAKAMGITETTYNMKKVAADNGHSFNEKNLQDLVAYIKQAAEKITNNDK